MQHDIRWINEHRMPVVAPNPAYPLGRDLDGAGPDVKACKVSLPYPAKGCGKYVIFCTACGLRIIVTTAGRPDDPRTVRMACKETRQ